MKKTARKGISFVLSKLSPDLIKLTYWQLGKITLFGKSIDDAIIFFIPEKIQLQEQSLFLNQQDAMVSGSIALGLYERYEIEVFLSLLRPEMTVVDIGANIGYYTLLAAPRVASILAFEPDPTNYDFLVRNITGNNFQNVRSYRLAVSDRAGEIEFFVNRQNYGDRRIYSFDQGSSKTQVSTVALDDFLGTVNQAAVDFIKMDIQGAEGIALVGMDRILDQPHLELMMEFFPHGLRATGFDPVAILERLAGKQFEIYHMDINRRVLERVEDFAGFTAKFPNLDYANLYCKK